MITAIVLAAGRSRRMGTQKLLLPVAGRPMIATVVDQLLQCPVASVLVVVGSDGEPIRQALAGRGVEFIVNDQPESEMLHSVRCGLRAASQATTGAWWRWVISRLSRWIPSRLWSRPLNVWGEGSSCLPIEVGAVTHCCFRHTTLRKYSAATIRWGCAGCSPRTRTT